MWAVKKYGIFWNIFPKWFLKNISWADTNGYVLKVNQAFRFILKISWRIFNFRALNTEEERKKPEQI